MSKLTPTLYILIEESGRELRAKLLIAAAAAERRMTVVLGDQQLLMSVMGSLPPGIVVFKGSGGPQVPLMATAKSFGHATASIDEECLGVVSDGIFERLQPPDIARWCDVFLVNGQHYKEFLSNVLGIDPRRRGTSYNGRNLLSSGAVNAAVISNIDGTTIVVRGNSQVTAAATVLAGQAITELVLENRTGG